MLGQTYGNLELIVVLDGVELNPGDSWMRDPRVRVERLYERVGTPRALNHGASRARGKYIARLDADDIAQPERLVEQVKVLELSPNLVCLGSSVRLIDAEGEIIGHLDAPAGPRVVVSKLLERNIMVHSSVIYRADSFRAVGGYNPECTRMQDYDLFLRLATIGEIDNCAAAFTSYRVHLGQHSRHSSPWGKYTREVLRGRSRLARREGIRRSRQLVRNATWFTYQIARHYGWVRPGYLRRKRPGT